MRGFGGQVQRAVQRGLGWASTATGAYELGKGLYTAGKFSAPIVADNASLVKCSSREPSTTPLAFSDMQPR